MTLNQKRSGNSSFAIKLSDNENALRRSRGRPGQAAAAAAGSDIEVTMVKFSLQQFARTEKRKCSCGAEAFLRPDGRR